MVKQDAEQISMALISLLRHALNALPKAEGVSVHLSRNEANIFISDPALTALQPLRL
jgi:hypothetical protein